MLFNIDGKEKEGQAYSVAYGNDLLDGILIDFDEQYIFLSDHVESHRDFMEDEDFEGMEHFDLTDCEVDYDDVPHAWIIKSVGRMVVATAEGLLET